MTRSCDECQVCCELPMVAALKKPMFTRCDHQCAQGCGIYGKRPDPCRAFECVWLRGDALLEDEDRPDRMGLMIETCVSTAPGGDTIQYAQVWETWPGALEDKESRAAVLSESLASRWPLKLQPYRAPTRYLSPPHLADVARELERRTKSAPRIKAAPNSPCPCGSGEVFVRCHGR